MHNLFREDAKEWDFAIIADAKPPFRGGYEESVNKLKEVYKSVTRQDRIKQVLDFLTFDEFFEGSGTYSDLKSALDKLKTRIFKLTQQFAPAFRGTEHQLAHL